MTNGTAEEDVLKGTPMDELLKRMVFDNFNMALQFSINNRDKECFMCYKALYHWIEPYEFGLKAKLRELTGVLTEHINNLGGRPLNTRDQIVINQKRMVIKDLLQIYMSEIPKAYAELGLWFKVRSHREDYELTVSQQNFNSDLSTLDNKRKELLRLKTKELIKLMKPSQVHDCYAKMRIYNALEI